MKKILITGVNSYIGNSFENYLKQWPEGYQVDKLSLVDGSWREKSFRDYDVVFHVAGIAHMPRSKNNPEQAALYEQVNTRLAIEAAKKAKADGAGQFLFMSSASVYGMNGSLNQPTVITKDTPVAPTDNYGISKAKAEEGILPLSDDSFRVVILRPPMIYGKGCKGNYVTLAKLAKKLPVFPWVNNQRSMLYVENFSEFVRLLVDNEEQGIFCPQNNEYTNTAHMAKRIAQIHGKRLLLIKGFHWALKLLSYQTELVNRAFGNLCYDRELSRYKQDYCVKTLEESIQETESE